MSVHIQYVRAKPDDKTNKGTINYFNNHLICHHLKD